MRLWRQKCAAQIDLLGVCVMSKALESKNGQYSSGIPPRCPFKLSVSPSISSFKTVLAYTTPGCLVYVHETNERPSSLHDPCQFHNCTSSSLILDVSQDITGRLETRLKFDPRSMVDPLEVRGTWSHTAPSGVNQTSYNDFLTQVEDWHSDLTREMPGRFTDMSLLRRALLDEEKSGIGSPNTGANNGKDVGVPLKTATERSGDNQGNTRHCDMMVVSWSDITPFIHYSGQN